MDHNDAIRARALRYLRTDQWCNPIVVAESGADEDIVQERGSGKVSDYRKIRIEVELRPEYCNRVMENAPPDERRTLARFLPGKWTFDITCSRSDIIDVSSPHMG